MRFIKRTVLALVILISLGVVFRGWVYRNLVTYKSVGLRRSYVAKDKKLIGYLETKFADQNESDIGAIIQLGLTATSAHLSYAAHSSNSDPNTLIHSNAAHCVGYASFFATACNYLLRKHKLAEQWTARPQIGHLYFLGTNVHKYFDSPFFKDHDFVTIENTATGETYSVDPTLHDYLFIDLVTSRK